MSEVSMWLFPVAIVALIGLIISARIGLRWTWGICLQQILILVVTAVGFVFLYAAPPSVPREAAAEICAIVAWSMFIVFNVIQRIVLNQLSLDLSLFRIQQAIQKAKFARWLTWGPPGEYWMDMAKALNHYNSGQVQEADEVIDRWHSDKRMPAIAKETLIGFSLLGRVLLHDWEGIVRAFESNQPRISTSKTFVPYQMASRAYAELGRYAEAEECLRKANMQPTKTSATNLDINFMTVFALFGAIDQLHRVFEKCRDFTALPPYVRDYWLGRCHAVRGEREEATAALEKCKSSTPVQFETWHKRIDQQLANQKHNFDNTGDHEGRPYTSRVGEGLVPSRAANQTVTESLEQLYERLRTIVDVLRPTVTKHGVIFLTVALVVAYVISNANQFLTGITDQATLETLHKQCYRYGELAAPRLLKGEWWTVVTYLFLHGNSAHLLLNSFALYIFGRSVENTYGTGKFLVIFFGSGILSGILQVALVPWDSAIGASGAILGVFGAATAGIIKLKHILPANVRRSELKWMVSIAVAQVIFDQVVNVVAEATDKSPNGIRIAAFAHLGGMIVGFIIGMLLPLRKFKNHH